MKQPNAVLLFVLFSSR